MEPKVGIEPTTYRLRIDCSTTELLRPVVTKDGLYQSPAWYSSANLRNGRQQGAEAGYLSSFTPALKSPHTGQDYNAPSGTPVKAVAGGKVRLAADFYYSGLTLFLDHGAGLVSVYMHLEKMLVAEGETVSAGQVIGRVGSTGRATGPHLHLGVRLFEQRVDPETLWGLF